MATTARLDLASRRYEAREFFIRFVGMDFVDEPAAVRAQVRLEDGTPGAPQIELAQTLDGEAAEGLYIFPLEHEGETPVTVVRGRLSEATMKNAAKVPFAGEVGAPMKMRWAMKVVGQTRVWGDFWVIDSPIDSDNAPSSRAAAFGSAQAPQPWREARVAFEGDQVRLSIDGADQLAPLLVRAKTLTDQAVAAAASALQAKEEVSGARVSLGLSLADSQAFAQAFGTAQLRYDGQGQPRGADYPQGATGTPTYAGMRFPLDLRDYAGGKIRISVGVLTSATFTRTLSMNLLVTTAGSDAPRAFDFKVDKLDDGMIYHFDYTLQGDEVGYGPFLQDTVAAQTTTPEFWEISDLGVSLISVPARSGSAGDITLERRLGAFFLRSSSPVVHVAMSGGDFTSIADAVQDITDAGPSRQYLISLHPHPDVSGWELPSEVAWKDHIDLEGFGPDLVRVAFHQPPSASLSDIEQWSAFRVHHEAAFRRLCIDVRQARYVFHIDDPAMIGKTILIEDCFIEHLGNQQARDYQASIGANPDLVWNSVSAIGAGTYQRSTIRAARSYFKAIQQPFAVHNANTAQPLPSNVILAGNTLEATTPGGIALQLNSIGSGQRDCCDITGNRFIGSIAQDAPVQNGAPPEWIITGYGNGAVDLVGNAIRHRVTDLAA